jgi:hypothetical protein
MEKYGQRSEDLVAGLRVEEASLINQIQSAMGSSMKYANHRTVAPLETRLAQVRATIRDHDLKRNLDIEDFTENN